MIITKNNLFKNPKNLLNLIYKTYKTKGILKTIKIILNNLFMRLKSHLWYNINYRFKKTNFIFNKKTLFYFYHSYNTTWRNERCIEIPIIKCYLEKYKNKKILEVGRVLSHYFNKNHDIIDKYEKAENVINKDIIEFSSKIKYDLIVSISTLEHIGWDEKPQQPEKIFKAIKKLKQNLNKDGKIIFTLPLGENPYLENLIKNKKIKIDELYLFKKISKKPEWKQINKNEIDDIIYNSPFPKVNGIIIGIIKK